MTLPKKISVENIKDTLSTNNIIVHDPNAELEYDSAYLRLTTKQQLCVELMARLDEPMSISAIANAASIELETLNIWRRSNADFQQALDEAQKPMFISLLKTLSRADLIKRYKSGEGLTREDRVLSMKITGDTNNDVNVQNNVQVNIAKEDW